MDPVWFINIKLLSVCEHSIFHHDYNRCSLSRQCLMRIVSFKSRRVDLDWHTQKNMCDVEAYENFILAFEA